MKIRKGLAVLAAGTILAAAGAAYSAPLQEHYYRDDARQVRIAESQIERGERLIRRGQELERRGNWRKGEELERQGRQLVREAQRHEHDRRW
jgi:hypothetical protein